MTQRERMRACYRHEPMDRVPWLANMDHWYNVNRARGTLPEEYREWSLWDIQRDLGISIWQRVGVVTSHSDAQVTTRTEQDGEQTYTYYETPLGTVRTMHTLAPDFTQARYQKELFMQGVAPRSMKTPPHPSPSTGRERLASPR